MPPDFGHDSHGTAVGHLVVAMGHARQGKRAEAEKHLTSARLFAATHAAILRSQGQHEESKRYMDSFGSHESTIKAMINEKSMKKAEDKKACVCKSEVCKCKKEDIEKADDYKAKPSAKTHKPPAQPTKVGAVHGNPAEYDYKHIGDLHPDDQMRAQRFFNYKDTARFKYPVDKQSGRIVHGQRMPIGADETPPVGAKSSFTEVPSHLREGAAVRFHAPGTKLHGRFGVVGTSSPYYPDKLMVHVGSLNNKVYAHPDLIKPTKPHTRIEKALVTLNNIRKAY